MAIALILCSHLSKGNTFVDVHVEANNKKAINITPYLYWVNGSDTILFSKSRGLVNQEHRFVFYVTNKSDSTVKRVIRFGERYQNVTNVSFLSITNHTESTLNGFYNYVSLELLPLETKAISFVVRELNRDDPQQISVGLLTRDQLEENTNSMYIQQSFFLGLFAFICLFNLIMYFVTSWATYLKYALFVFFALLYFLYFFGIIQDVFPWVQTISYNLVRIWYSLIFISYFYFVNDFGNYKNLVPKAYRLLNFGISFKLIESFINTFLHYSGWQFIYSSFYKFAVLGFEITLMGFIVFYILKNKNIRGRIVIVAASLMIIGGIVDQLILFKNFDNVYFMEIAVVLELLTFSVGLGYTTKLFFQEKQENQHLYIAQLKENEKIQKELSIKLEEKVRLRTADLEKEKLNVESKNKENELLLGEIHHRVKNNLQTISSLLSIQQRKLKDPESIKVLEDSKNRVMAMGLIHQHLYQNATFAEIDFKSYTKELVQVLIATNACCDIDLTYSIPALRIELDNAMFFGLIINELAINSIKHAYDGVKNPTLEISIYALEEEVVLLVKDNGNQANIEFDKSNSFGWKMVHNICEKLDAQLFVDNSVGLTIKILFSKEIIDFK